MNSGFSCTELRNLSSDAFFPDEDQVGMQPLDLRIHPKREEPTPKKDKLENHKPVCSAASAHNVGTAHNHRPSPYHRKSKSDAISANPAIVSSLLSRTDLSVHAKQQNSSPESYHNARISSETPHPLLSRPAHLKTSSFQLRTTSPKCQTTCPVSSTIFNSYNEKSDSYNEVNNSYNEKSDSYNEVHNQHHESSPQRKLNHDETENEPTSMDLDIAPLNLPDATTSGESSFVDNKKDISKVLSKHPRKIEDKIDPGCYSLKSRNKNDRGFFEIKSKMNYNQDEASEAYRRGTYKKGSCSINRPPNSQQHQNQQLQLCFPDSTSGPNHARPSPLDPKLTSSNPSVINFQLPKCNNRNPTSEGSTTLPSSPDKDNSPSPHVSQFPIYDPCTMKQSIHETTSRKKTTMHTTQSSTTNNHIPTSTTTRDGEIIGNKPERNSYNSGSNYVNSSSSDIEKGDNSTGVNVLDFWITKVLLERSADAPTSGKPCNVDYICSANGDRRIRFRLVDLIELQVEQSLKA